ncbi:hypothetical protein MPLB_630051 [Mesorhizobium sp. ORS 3324]|nr:hypothetical protein MPLB_630051 [Mesorhizobium sp. ORS 3324]
MPASAAMTREPSIWRSSRGVRTSSPPSRMVNVPMGVALTSPAGETEAGPHPNGTELRSRASRDALDARQLPLAWRFGRAYVSRCSNGVPDADFADRLRGDNANPLNLIRFVPAEGLDVSDHPTPQFL